MNRKGRGITAGAILGVAAGALVGVALMTRFQHVIRWLWTDAGFVFQLILGALITWAVFWFIRRMHPGQPVGEVIRAHFATSRKLGAYGFVHALGEPIGKAIEWSCYQGTCWLVEHFPRAGAAWVELTRPWVESWRKDGEALEAKKRQRILDYDAKHPR